MGVLRIQLLTHQQLSKFLTVISGFYLQISICAFPTTAGKRHCCFNEVMELPWCCSAWTWMSKWKVFGQWEFHFNKRFWESKCLAWCPVQSPKVILFFLLLKEPFPTYQAPQKNTTYKSNMHLFWFLCFSLADVKVAESLMQAVHPGSLKTIQNIKKFKYVNVSFWFMYLDLLSTEYSENTFWWVRMLSTYPHCCSGFWVGTENIHILTGKISLMVEIKLIRSYAYSHIFTGLQLLHILVLNYKMFWVKNWV